MRGNHICTAVGFIIGEVFQKIADTIVHKLILSITGMLTGGVNF